jgi:hypothetical protein
MDTHCEYFECATQTSRGIYTSSNIEPYCMYKALQDYEKYVLLFVGYIRQIQAEYFPDTMTENLHVHSKELKTNSVHFLKTAVYVLCHEEVFPDFMHDFHVDEHMFLCLSSRSELFSSLLPVASQEIVEFWEQRHHKKSSQKGDWFKDFCAGDGAIGVFFGLLNYNTAPFLNMYVQVQVMSRLHQNKQIQKHVELELIEHDVLYEDVHHGHKCMYFPLYLSKLYKDSTWVLYSAVLINPNIPKNRQAKFKIYIPSDLVSVCQQEISMALTRKD